jgi:hypothetical protein
MGVAEIQWEEYTKKQFFLFSSMTNELNAMMHITYASSCYPALVLSSSYELEAEASSFICHVMFMMRYTHHSCSIVGGRQRHRKGGCFFLGRFGRDGIGFRFYFVLLLCLVRHSTCYFMSSSFLFPQFLFPPFFFQPYGLVAEVIDILICSRFWFGLEERDGR